MSVNSTIPSALPNPPPCLPPFAESDEAVHALVPKGIVAAVVVVVVVLLVAVVLVAVDRSALVAIG